MKAGRISFAGRLAGVVAAAACALAAPASATAASTKPNKPYALVLAPASVASGSQAPIDATHTNLTSQQQLGSANLTPPAGFTVTSAQISGFSFSPAPSGASATVDGNVGKLRGLSLRAGRSGDGQHDRRHALQRRQRLLDERREQANDFNGPPGNDLTIDAAASSTTTTTGGCRLSFTTQPKDVEIGSTITGIAGNPAGPPVAVTVLDGAGVATTAAIPVTVGLGAAPAGATLDGTKTETSLNGVATFGTLSVTQAGIYSPTATSPGVASATSDPFKAHQVLVTCLNNEVCTATASTSGTVPGSNRPYTNTVKVEARENPDAEVPDDGGTLRCPTTPDRARTARPTDPSRPTTRSSRPAA